LTEILNKEYSKYVKEPDVELLIANYRPVKIFIDGEVLNPGFHILEGSSSLETSVEDFNINNQKSAEIISSNQNYTKYDNIFFPSVVDVIRKSGGITINADLKNIEVTRINNISNGEGRIKTKLNILNSLELKDNSQNIRIYDGDTILVKRSSEVVLSQISAAIKTNLNPKFINIYLGARVEQPGSVKVNKNATLVDAIDIGGGAKIIKGNINFLRYTSDGKIDKRIFRLKKGARRGSFRNPYLRDGDVIYIGKSALNLANEVISEITSPIRGVVETFGLYKIITD